MEAPVKEKYFLLSIDFNPELSYLDRSRDTQSYKLVNQSLLNKVFKCHNKVDTLG